MVFQLLVAHKNFHVAVFMQFVRTLLGKNE